MTTLGGIERAGFLLVHAAPIEGYGLEDLGVHAIGVGKVASAVHMAELLRRREDARAVLLFGVAGAFPARHRQSAPPAGPGGLVVVGSERLGDDGVETPDGFLDLGAMQLGDVGPFAADPRLARDAANRLGAPLVDGVTVSTGSGTESTSQRVCARSGADVESMEGAAVAYVCRLFERPLLQVRAISNWTGDRDRGEWNIGAAVDAVQRGVRRLWHGG
ncbi:MAG: futalosine hydrolase [Planctomycetota bacterium]|nr:futalosine hydrolase [Planctomycetota bacterium]